jgi:hypothetical protein
MGMAEGGTRSLYEREQADVQDQMHLKLHLPEKLSCFAVSPNGCWAAGGSPNGQIYLWEVSPLMSFGYGILTTSSHLDYYMPRSPLITGPSPH